MKEKQEEEGWPRCPKEFPYYRTNWGSNDFYDKPFDWHDEESEYDRKVEEYRQWFSSIGTGTGSGTQSNKSSIAYFYY
jgi:hypothetical protein